MNKKLQGRVQFPIGGILREPAMAGTGAIPVATVKVWMEEDFLKSFLSFILRGFCEKPLFLWKRGADPKEEEKCQHTQ